jgi:hypothetical protein
LEQECASAVIEVLPLKSLVNKTGETMQVHRETD